MSCKIIKIKEELSAIICGNKDHQCNEASNVLLLSEESDEYEVEDTELNRLKYKNFIIGQSVCCSICGQSAFSNAISNSFF